MRFRRNTTIIAFSLLILGIIIIQYTDYRISLNQSEIGLELSAFLGPFSQAPELPISQIIAISLISSALVLIGQPSK